MKVLVCGGRDFTDHALLNSALDRLHAKRAITLIIQGEARGADTLAKRWAVCAGVECVGFEANWDRYRERAGSERNARMLRASRPDLVVCFPGGSGTRDMEYKARNAGVPVWIVREGPRIKLGAGPGSTSAGLACKV